MDAARALVKSGNPARAVDEYKAVLTDYPECSVCYFELAGVYWRAGLLREAEQAYRCALKLDPGNADINCNLGAVVWRLSGLREAEPFFLAAIHCDSRNLTAMFNLAGLYLQDGACADAVHWFDRVLDIDPRHAQAWMYKGNAHFEMGEYEQAMACYRRHAELNPSGGARIRIATAIPMIPRSTQHISAIRRDFMSNIQRLVDERIVVTDPVRENGFTNFFLAYHGCDDLPLQRKYAELYERACPSLLYEATHCRKGYAAAGVAGGGAPGGKIRVGFISKYFKGHSIGKTSYGIIEKLDRTQFEVVCIFLGAPSDRTGSAIASVADEVLVLPNDLEAARTLVEGKLLDILFYQDIGMDPFTYFLAFSRLAPVQCASFGHPVTSGIGNIDYYISTELWEPEDADSHYSETLIRLRDVASVAYYYEPRRARQVMPRASFGLPDACHLYICPQTLFKFHPDFDRLLAEVLRTDPDGLVVLIEGKHKPWAEILRQRFQQSVPDVADRIRFVPRQDGERYMALLQVADVMLDTVHFCGFNTSLEGLVAGLPVVTLPGRYMRSRHTAAFYRKMGYCECIASDAEQYVQLAVRLGRDERYRRQVVDEIQGRLPALWEERKVVDEFERFFRTACDTRNAGVAS